MEKKKVPGLLLLVFVIGGMVPLGCSKEDSFQSVQEGSVIVTMKGSTFTPENTYIVQGGYVTWVNDDNRTHTIVSQDGEFNNVELKAGARYTHTFREKGNFNYRCLHHDGIASILVVSK